MFTVYVLHSEKHDKIYIGYTSNLQERFKSHNELGNKGWTVKYRPWKIIHTELYDTKPEAMAREKELKGGQGRNWIRNTILNP
ncbi:MAG: GIY-YIG nuclease family protein [Balneolaceae bacterium]|nr:GIY-YIG nuclease family protein [Balneolaceae bacterium]